MSILKIKNENGEWQGITSVKGDKGDPGVSPDITVSKNDRKTYQLTVDTKYRKFTTPNLRPNESAYIGNTDGELGMIDNWYEPEGHRVTPYLSELPKLPRMSSTYPTRYVFDHNVTMYTLDGEPNDKDICSIEDYTKHEGSEIVVQPNGQDYLTDYIIYNARPKYEWDTWEDKQLMKKTLGFPNSYYDYKKNNSSLDGNRTYPAGSWNWVDAYMVATKDIGPAVCDDGLYYWGMKDALSDKGFLKYETGTLLPYDDFLEGAESSWESSRLGRLVYNCPLMKKGIWNQMEGEVDGNCCGEMEDWGITKIIRRYVTTEAANRAKFPREMGMTIFAEGHIKQNTDVEGNNALKDADKHMGIFVALDPDKNYTIETLNGQVAIYAPYNNISLANGASSDNLNYGKHVGKVKSLLMESYLETISIERKEETQIVGENTVQAQGKVPIAGDKVLGTKVSYYVNENPDAFGLAEVPSVFNTPHKVLDKGESLTFRISNYKWEVPSVNPVGLWGIYLFCWNPEDYNGIKIVEGVEPYSTLDSERMAAGATKFNLKVKFGDTNSGLADVNTPRYEYNIKLVDTTDNNGYVRYLTNEMKKSYDLDEFSLVGHKHKLEDISDLENLTKTIPKMEVSTVSLADGTSPLAENTFYFVYEGE